MAFTARVLNVLIASPGDTAPLRDVVEQALQSWNRDRAESAQVILRPLRWEFDAVSALGIDAQSVINEQLVEKSDILIGLFYSRLGSATARSASGTAEEIDEAARGGKKVHVYFSEMPIPRDTKPEDLTALNEFKATLEQRMLLGSFTSPDDLVARVRTAIEQDLADLTGNSIPGARESRSHAALHAEYRYDREPRTDNRGKTTYHTRNERIEVHNTGTRSAEGVTLTMSTTEGDVPHVLREAHPTIPPHGKFNFLVATDAGTGLAVDVVFAWREGEEQRSGTQTVSLT